MGVRGEDEGGGKEVEEGGGKEVEERACSSRLRQCNGNVSVV